MNTMHAVSRMTALLAVVAVVFALFLAVERPSFLNWGATDAEVSAPLPGDGHVPAAAGQSTRAVTIAAPAERVWPWLAQLGQDRAGFYSYEILEDLVGGEMPGATAILPERQAWHPGDRLWMYPPRKAQGQGSARLVAFEPGRHMVFAMPGLGSGPGAPEGTWGFYVEPVGAGSTRLLTRGRAPSGAGAGATVFDRLVFEPAHHAMERRMLLNIKALAEGRRTSKTVDTAMVVLWTLTIAVLVASLIQVFRRPHWAWPLAIATGAALLFQYLTLVQPPLWAAATLVVLLTGGFACDLAPAAPMRRTS
ncbi:MAG TPA: hypothetical protein VJY35_03860 [Candidatus Eisenbacteria bacterium]|nr:hypothetical protein [Candidatus Eisenbacteria bacterium]